MLVFRKPLAFEWDRGNRGKNERKHGVTDGECEEAFFDPHKRMLRDVLHSGAEERYLLIGATQAQRILFVVFTMRSHTIRIISTRDLSRKERHLYGKTT